MPEFCAQTTPEKGATPCSQRNNEFFACGVFYLLNCCTNVARKARNGGGRLEARGDRERPGTPISRLALEERWGLLLNRRGRGGPQRKENQEPIARRERSLNHGEHGDHCDARRRTEDRGQTENWQPETASQPRKTRKTRTKPCRTAALGCQNHRLPTTDYRLLVFVRLSLCRYQRGDWLAKHRRSDRDALATRSTPLPPILLANVPAPLIRPSNPLVTPGFWTGIHCQQIPLPGSPNTTAL